MQIHRAEQILLHHVSVAVVVHLNFLRNDPALFFHTFLGEIRRRHQPQQDGQIFLKMLRTLDVVSRHRIARKGVVAASILREQLHRVALRQVEHLVLQIVRHAVRRRIVHAVQAKFRVDRPEIHRHKRIFLRKIRLFDHADHHAVLQPLLEILLAELRKYLFVHSSVPLSVKMVSSVTRRATSATCPRVTASMPRASSSIPPSKPAARCPMA